MKIKNKPIVLAAWLVGAVGIVGLLVCAFADGWHYAALAGMAFVGVMTATFPGFYD